jgi:hypothetical protein
MQWCTLLTESRSPIVFEMPGPDFNQVLGTCQHLGTGTKDRRHAVK